MAQGVLAIFPSVRQKEVLRTTCSTETAKEWASHRLPTDTGDVVITARGCGKVPEEGKDAQERARAASQSIRTASVKKAHSTFGSWRIGRSVLVSKESPLAARGGSSAKREGVSFGVCIQRFCRDAPQALILARGKGYM